MILLKVMSAWTKMYDAAVPEPLRELFSESWRDQYAWISQHGETSLSAVVAAVFRPSTKSTFRCLSLNGLAGTPNLRTSLRSLYFSACSFWIFSKVTISFKEIQVDCIHRFFYRRIVTVVDNGASHAAEY